MLLLVVEQQVERSEGRPPPPAVLPPTLAGSGLTDPQFGGCCMWARQCAVGHLCRADEGVAAPTLAQPGRHAFLGYGSRPRGGS